MIPVRPLSHFRAALLALSATWGPLLLVIFLAGCASSADGLVARGPLSSRDLMRVRISDDVTRECGERAAACAKPFTVTGCEVVIGRALVDRPEIYAHEFCHCLRAANGLPVGSAGPHSNDVCHDGPKTDTRYGQ